MRDGGGKAGTHSHGAWPRSIPGVSASTPGKQTLVQLAMMQAPSEATVPPAIDASRNSDGDSHEPRASLPPYASIQRLFGRGVQRKASETAGAPDVHAAAAEGISGAGSPLPHLDSIQRSFGRHDVRHVQAHLDARAAAGAQAMGAEAFATGDHVAFAGAPSLHTAAHEAAHVVQQRGGVQLAGGVGRTGDPYEQHADAVADAVVNGESAEALLDSHAAALAGAAPAIQRKVPTHKVTAGDLGTRGESQHAAELTEKQAHAAIAWNDQHWTGLKRQELRAFLAHGHASAGGFTEDDIRAVRKIQLGAGVEPAKADGRVDDTTMAILLHAGLKLGFSGEKAKAEDVQLLFIPGEFEDVAKWQAAVTAAIKQNPQAPYRAILQGRVPMPSGTGRVYVKLKGNIVDVVDARGGPAVTVKDFGGHTADPTTAGEWTLGAGKSVVTPSWDRSQIPWGAEVRKRTDGEWEFKDPQTSKWKIATGPKSQLANPLDVEAFEGATENQGRSTWRLNDFGEMGWRIQGTDGQFIHTTPEDEETTLAGSAPELAASHGCVHLDPAGRTRLRDRGYLQAGVKFVVRKYTVHLLPEAMRQIMQGDKPLHGKRTP